MLFEKKMSIFSNMYVPMKICMISTNYLWGKKYDYYLHEGGSGSTTD